MALRENIGQIEQLVQDVFRQEDGLKRVLEALLNGVMQAEAGVHVGAEFHERSGERHGCILANCRIDGGASRGLGRSFRKRHWHNLQPSGSVRHLPVCVQQCA